MPNDYTVVERMARTQDELVRTIESLTERLKGFQDHLRQLSEFDLPEAIDALEWDPERMTCDEVGDEVRVTLPNGRVVMVKDTFHPHITNANKVAAFDWIIAQGDEALLRTDISLSFRRGEIEPLRNAVNALKEAVPNHEPDINRTIHPSTLAKYCRDKIAEGVDLPDSFGVFNRRVATVALDNSPRRVPPVASLPAEYQ